MEIVVVFNTTKSFTAGVSGRETFNFHLFAEVHDALILPFGGVL